MTLHDAKIRSHLRCTKLIYFWNSHGLFSWTFHLSRSMQSSTRTTPFLPLPVTASSAGEPPDDASSARTADLALPVDGGLGEDSRGEQLGNCLRSAFDGLLCLCLRGERDREPGCLRCERCQPVIDLSKLALNDLPTRLPH